MANEQSIKVPDIGESSQVDVIDILVKVGDQVQQDDPLVTLESDKASMDIPTTVAGKITAIEVSEGDQVSEGDVLVRLETESADSADQQEQSPAADDEKSTSESQSEATHSPDQQEQSPAADKKPASESQSEATHSPEQSSTSVNRRITVPDMGDFDSVEVIEIHVAVGDQVELEQPLITLESDKASMEVPAESAGEVVELAVAVGDKISQGDTILTLQAATVDDHQSAATQHQPETEQKPTSSSGQPAQEQPPAEREPFVATPPVAALPVQDHGRFVKAHASPSIRRFARELGVDLGLVGEGSGRKGRITEQDVKQFVKQTLSQSSGKIQSQVSDGSGIPPVPAVDFSQFGEIEERKLSKIKRLTGKNLSRSWLNLPHVTNHDETDITDTEAFRKSLAEEAKQHQVRLTMLSFLLKACALSLKQFPNFNASLHPELDRLILKKYVHIGVAVDTPGGLVVPVVRDVDKKSLFEISADMGELSVKARDKKLSPKEMQGGCFTISSLGGIGGTSFTPIVNAPEVAILGVSRSKMTPVWQGDQFVPRLMLPLSLSYDHRVLDGAEVARFLRHLAALLSDPRRMLL